jgi:hypothetical protein
VLLPIASPSRVIDLATGAEIARLKPGAPDFKVAFDQANARAFVVKP